MEDQNGNLEKIEIEKIYVAIYDLLGEEKENRKGENDPKIRVFELFKKLDKDSSGFLSEEEFIEGCLSKNLGYYI
jgi:Ca2+-binding EF-hand superfamily protein